MTAPSNANTSGLEVVAHRMRQLHHEIDGPITGWMYCPPSQHPSGNARWDVEPLVTAASAQARISGLQREVSVAVAAADHMADRATEAEARADRLASGISSAKLILTPEPGDAPLTEREKEARQLLAALQQDTQP